MDTTSKWQQRVARWRASGGTAEAFSAREGFAASTLRWWASKLAREKAAAKPSSSAVGMVQLIRVPAVAEAARPGGKAVIVELLDVRARLRVEPGVDAGTLKTVLAVLGVRGAA